MAAAHSGLSLPGPPWSPSSLPSLLSAGSLPRDSVSASVPTAVKFGVGRCRPLESHRPLQGLSPEVTPAEQAQGR